jgi:hypothetical protein
MWLAHIIHEHFCCNHGFAAATSWHAGFMACQRAGSLLGLGEGHIPMRRGWVGAIRDVLSQGRLPLSRLHAQDTAASPTRRRPQTWEDTASSPSRRRAQAWRDLFIAPCASLFFVPWTSLGDFVMSRRTVMNNVG